jgi:hypothetical protein
MSRTTSVAGTRLACSASRASRSGVTASSGGTPPSVWVMSSSRAWASRSRTNWVTSRPGLDELAAAPSAERASWEATASSAPKSSSASATPRTASTSSTWISVPEYVTSCSSVPSASRKEPVAWRASSATASAGDRDGLLVGDALHHARELLDRRPEKSKRWQRSTTVGRTFDASVVASTKIVDGGGSSSVLRNAFHACVESMCASSRM